MNEEQLQKAKELATLAHEGVTRKYGNIPYITHPEWIYNKICELQGLPEEEHFNAKCAAWLHDTIEDCSEKFPNIKELILGATNTQVLQMVEGLTNPSKAMPWLARSVRKGIDRDHVAKAKDITKIIKLFDRLHNVMDLAKQDYSFARVYSRETRALLLAIKFETEPYLSIGNSIKSEIEKCLE